MNIIYLSDDFPPQSFGGAGIIAYTDAQALVARGHKVTVITTTGTLYEVGEKVVDGIEVVTLYSSYNLRWRHYVSLWNPPLVGKIKKIIKEKKAEVVHAHNIHTSISYKVLSVARKSGAKVFLTMHDVMAVHYGKFVPPIHNASTPPSTPATIHTDRTTEHTQEDLRIHQRDLFKTYKFRYNPFRQLCIRHYIKNVTALFAVSEAVKKILEANGIRPIHVIHNGINVDNWLNNPEEDIRCKALYSAENSKTVLFGGRMSALKGSGVMMSAFSLVLNVVPNAMLLLVGKIDEQTQKTLQEKYPDVVAHCKLLGWKGREEMKCVYAASDVVVVPSLYVDPFPTVNLEAMASAKPVVGTSFGGTPEAVLDGVTGYIVNPHDTKVLAQKIVELLLDEKKAQAFGQAGEKRVIEQFNMRQHIEKLLSWYTSN